MATHEEKIKLMREYAPKIRTCFNFHIKGDIPSKIIDNALKKFAFGMDRNEIIGFYDTTITNNGKLGYIFTDDKIYYLEQLEKPKKLWYDDIKGIELDDTYKKDCDQIIKFELYDGSKIKWISCFLNKPALKEFMIKMIKLDNPDFENTFSDADFGIEYLESIAIMKSIEEDLNDSEKDGSLYFGDDNLFGATAGGYAAGAYGQVNKSFNEEKFHASQGHGFAAENANNLFDKMTGHDAKIVGDDNAKNGADRVVDGVFIQSKYCQTGKACVDACFDDSGSFRYFKDGKPMQIEVPSDKYDAAVQAMEEKIKNGQVQGVSDPNEAKNIIRKGHFTYEQAKNIAKAGTVESITYDAVNGAIIASTAFGITALLTFSTSVWNGEDFDTSIKLATYSGLKVGGTAFITTIIAGQLSKAGLNSALVGSSEAIVAMMGPKASAILINAFRSGSNIYGAAAMKSAAKLLRGNAITAGVTVIVLSSFDVANIFRGRISGKQLFKNLTNTAATVGGGSAGWLAGAAAGSAVLPGAGTIVGGLIGSVAVGALAGKATDTIVGSFIEDDAEEMVRIIEKVFGELAEEYLLSRKEAEKSCDKLRDTLDGKTLKDMFASSNRRKFAREMLIPIIENEVKKRKHIEAPSDEQMFIALKDVLEDISDNYELATT